MERPCEFCLALRPVVLCESDAAYLCLSCDAKIHSANALSYRHPRTLVCELCRHRPARVRCLDHEMFMCQSCDSSHHASLEHQKRVISCYMGCPSATDLAELWGIDLTKDHSFAAADSKVLKVTRVKREASLSDGMILKCGGGFNSRGTKVVNDDNRQQNNFLILQQIMDLERLQLSEGIVGDSCLLQVKERRKYLPARRNLNPHTEYFDGVVDFQEKNEEPLSSPFLQLDHSFWQCKSPLQNNEIWLQNMQDLGVCDDVQCFDDVNIPDVDLTFKNFEEIFVEDSKNTASSFDEDHPAFGILDKLCGRTIQENAGKETGKVDQLQVITQHSLTIRPSNSASSFPVSRITGESSSSEFKDDGISPTSHEQMIPRDTMSSQPEGNEKTIMRYKEKKVLRHERQARYASPWFKSELRKQEKGKPVIASSSVNV